MQRVNNSLTKGRNFIAPTFLIDRTLQNKKEEREREREREREGGRKSSKKYPIVFIRGAQYSGSRFSTLIKNQEAQASLRNLITSVKRRNTV